MRGDTTNDLSVLQRPHAGRLPCGQIRDGKFLNDQPTNQKGKGSFHLTHLTPPKKHTQKNTRVSFDQFLLIKKKLETFLLQNIWANIHGSISPTFVDSERRYFSLSKLSTNPMKTNMEPKKKWWFCRCFSFFQGDLYKVPLLVFLACYFKLPIIIQAPSSLWELMSDFSSLQVYAVLATTVLKSEVKEIPFQMMISDG